MIKHYKGEDFSKLTKKRILVDFYANWCGPCKMLGPVLEKVSDDIDVLKIDVDNYQDLAREYKVMSIPCLIIFEDEKELARSVGFLNEEKLKDFIKG